MDCQHRKDNRHIHNLLTLFHLFFCLVVVFAYNKTGTAFYLYSSIQSPYVGDKKPI